MGLFSIFRPNRKPEVAAAEGMEVAEAQRQQAQPVAAVAAGTPLPSKPLAVTVPGEEDLVIRVQLQESFSPAKAVHLILLPASKSAEGSLGHGIAAWLGDRPEPEESAAAQTPGKLGGLLAKARTPSRKASME